MPAPGYQWWVGDLRTGLLVKDVDLTDFRWSIDITGYGTMEGSFPLRSGEWPDVDADTAYPKASLAVEYIAEDGTDTLIEAGPLIPGDFDEDENLPVGGAGLRTYYDWRKALPPLPPGVNPAKQVLTYTAAERGLIHKRLIELAHSHLGGAMPVILPEDDDLGGEGTAYKTIIKGYELSWIGKVMSDLSGQDGGPELQFVPRRRTDDLRFMEWVARIGREADSGRLGQSGDPWIFDRSVPESPVKGIKIAKDLSRKTYRSWAAGSGDGENRLIGWAENMGQVISGGYALVESEVSSTDTIECGETLASFARADLRADLETNDRGFEVWTVKVTRDGRLPGHKGPACPNVGQYRPGDTCLVPVRNHYEIPDGDYDMRIVKMSGDTSAFVELQMAPIRSVIV